MGYSNPEVDKLIEQAIASTDQEERAGIYQEIQKILLEDLPWVSLFVANQYEAMKTTSRATSTSRPAPTPRSARRGSSGRVLGIGYRLSVCRPAANFLNFLNSGYHHAVRYADSR